MPDNPDKRQTPDSRKAPRQEMSAAAARQAAGHETAADRRRSMPAAIRWIVPWLRFAAAQARMVRRSVIGLTGWRRAVVAMGAGALGVLAMAPYYALPALGVSAVLLVWLTDGAAAQPVNRRFRHGFWTGWFFSFGFMFFGLQWVGHAFLVNAEVFAWLLPLAITLLPAGLSLFVGVALGFHAWCALKGPQRIGLLAATWTLAEWVRGHVLTGFPWNLMGLSFVGHGEMAQFGAIVGSYGLSFIVIYAAASLALLADRSDHTVPRGARGEGLFAGNPWLVTLGVALVLGGMWLWGAQRLAQPGPAPVADMKLRIVQPGTRQVDRRDPDKRARIWAQLLSLTADARERGVTHVVWPEAAPPFLLPREIERRRQLAELLAPGMVLMTGTLRAERDDDPDAVREWDVFNSFAVFDDQARLLSTYDKHHLVPFGEYLPAAPILSILGLRKIVEEVGALTVGEGQKTLQVPGAPPVAPAICYEIIFPGAVTDPADRPQWIVNVTDDDWFGDSIGPRQHLAIARMRAIEENLPVIRSANSGISAVIDRQGRVLERLGLSQVGVIDAALPAAGPRTLYARLGDWPVLLVCLALCLWGIVSPRRRA